MDGILAGGQVSILKDDGCNTNVISKSYVNRHRHALNIVKGRFEINHSNKNTTKEANEVVLNTPVQIGSHIYHSNWIVADCRYDILLGMPWNVQCKPKIDYVTGSLRVDGADLPTTRDRGASVKIHNLGVKKFRSLLRKKKKTSDDFVVFRVQSINNVIASCDTSGCDPKDDELNKLKEGFRSVFTDELPNGLPQSGR